VSVRLTVLILAFLVLVAVPGCVYYNTFYHATVAAREAELLRQDRPPGTDPTAAENELLDRVIEKCGRVIKLHPDSDWADDALVLMGEALYRQRKYDNAEERFTEFVALYPESELRPRAEYFLAAVRLAKGNAVSAEELLSEVAYADPPSDLSDDALFLIGDARRSRKHYAEAAEAYRQLLDRFRRSDRRAEVRFVAAENYIDMGRLGEAAAELDAVSGEKSSRQLAFESRIRLARVLTELGDTDRALAVLDDLERRTTARDDLDRILLARGRTYEAVGDFDRAKEVYGAVAFEHERSDAAGEAYYRIGLIDRDQARSFDDAIASFREAKEQAPRSAAAALATAAIADIEALREYLAVIEAYEKGEVPSAPPETDRAPAGEDSRGVTPRGPAARNAAPSGADSLGAASRERAAADSLGVASRERAAADSAAASPAGPIAPAQGPPPDTWSPWPPPEGPMPEPFASPEVLAPVSEEEPEIVVARFRAAEIYLFKLNSPSDALAFYESVVREHPTSGLAPKAAYAIAWIAENRADDPAGAAQAYRRVIEGFPGSRQADAAEDALERLEPGGADARGRVDDAADTPGASVGPPGPLPTSD
jgi:TolA-binding protein